MKMKWIYSLLILTCLVSLRISDPWIVEALRLKAMDSYQRNQKTEISSGTVVLNIDEKALDKYGQWPWPRDVLAKQIDLVRDAGAAVIVLPILFSESDRFNKDRELVSAIEKGGVVVAQSAATNGKGVPVPRGVSQIGSGFSDWLFNYNAAIGPIKSIGDAAFGVGMLLTAPEADGVTRRLPLVVQLNDEVYPSLALETLRTMTGMPSYQIKSNEGGVEAVRIPQFPVIRTDQNARIWVDFRYEAPSMSITENLDMAENSILKGKVVFIALTAEGLANQVATPVGIRYGHDLVINAIDTMISGRNLDRPFWADSAEIAITIAGSILIMILVLYCPWVVGIAAITGILGGVYFGSEYAFTDKNLILDWSFPIASIFIIWSASAFIRFISEFRQKMQIKKQFGTYLSPAMVEKLQKNPELLRLGGETRELSIMFTDVRGFTTISEHYGEDVQGLTKIMNRYMTAMTTRILANEGTIDKYIGDAQMALWNAPLDDANHRQNALRTALAMLDDLEKFNAEISSERIPAFGMGIGINSGPVVVGNMGSIQRFDYTCLGDNVNLAARLEGQSKEYGVKIVLGENTITGLDEDFVILELDTIAVKGKSIGVRIFTCLGHFEDIDSFRKTKNDQLLHRNMLENYRQKKFKSCMRRLAALCGGFGGKMDDYYDMMNARCVEFEANPPEENWDGVYRAKTK